MKPRSRLPLYLLLNIIVSAATTLVVLLIWDATRKPDQTQLLMPLIAPQSIPTQSVPAAEGTLASTPTRLPTLAVIETLPAIDTPLIQIISVIGAGDLEQEVVLLRRIGEGNLRMTDWSLFSSRGVKYVFSDQPELILYKDGAVQIYSKAGTDTATEIYWNRIEPAWQSGDTLSLLDPDGNVRASYVIP